MTLRNDCHVLVVDDHALVRSGMRALLENCPYVSNISEAGSAEDALKLAEGTTFNLVLMDISLPGMSGADAVGKLLHALPDARVIMVSGLLDGATIRRLLATGVSGYVTKGSDSDEIEKAVKLVLDGERYLSPDVARQLAMDTLDGGGGNPFEQLSTREHEVIMLLLQGNRNRQIGESLHISEKTVSTHRVRAFEKLGITATAELVRLAMRHGLWDVDE